MSGECEKCGEHCTDCWCVLTPEKLQTLLAYADSPRCQQRVQEFCDYYNNIEIDVRLDSKDG